MYDSLSHLHSGTRWIILILLVYTIVSSYSNWKSGKVYRAKDKMAALFTFIFSHLQLTVGLILYFWDKKNVVQFSGGMMKNSTLRFYTMEHFLMMIVAVAIITFGYSRAKKTEGDSAKHRKIFIWYTVALILILAAIPWPFRIAGAGWF